MSYTININKLLQKERIKNQIEQLLNEKQTLENMLNTLQNQLENNTENKDLHIIQIETKYDQLFNKNAELTSNYQQLKRK